MGVGQGYLEDLGARDRQYLLLIPPYFQACLSEMPRIRRLCRSAAVVFYSFQWTCRRPRCGHTSSLASTLTRWASRKWAIQPVMSRLSFVYPIGRLAACTQHELLRGCYDYECEMPSDTVALVVAGISAAVSLTVGIGVELLRRRGDRKIQSLKTTQDEKLEKLRGAQALALEEAKAELARVREVATKAEEAARVIAKYRDPLLRSAYDLQSRIYNVYRPRRFRGGRDPEYFRLNTLFLLAEFLAWLEIIRREVQFLDLGAVQATKDLSSKLQRVQDQMSTTSRLRDNTYIYRGHQRAIGELMLVPVEGQTTAGPRYECMGYAAFVAAHEDPAFARWFTRLGGAIDRLRDDESNRPERLMRVQQCLIDLIDLLDPDRARFAKNRDRLPDPPFGSN